MIAFEYVIVSMLPSHAIVIATIAIGVRINWSNKGGQNEMARWEQLSKRCFVIFLFSTVISTISGCSMINEGRFIITKREAKDLGESLSAIFVYGKDKELPQSQEYLLYVLAYFDPDSLKAGTQESQDGPFVTTDDRVFNGGRGRATFAWNRDNDTVIYNSDGVASIEESRNRMNVYLFVVDSDRVTCFPLGFASNASAASETLTAWNETTQAARASKAN